jgi:hypothetical protein
MTNPMRGSVIAMKNAKTSVLHSATYRKAFTRLLGIIPRKPQHLEFLVPAETKSNRLIRTLLAEESRQNLCPSERATNESEQVLLQMDGLYFQTDDTDEHNQLIRSIAVSTGVWIAERSGEIREI